MLGTKFVISVLTDGLAPNVARPSASTELTTKLNMSSFHFLWLSYFQITFRCLLHNFIQNGLEDLPKSHHTLAVEYLFATPSLNMPVMSYDHSSVSNCQPLHCLFNNFPRWATKEMSKPYFWPFERGNHWCLMDLPHIGTSNAKVILCPLVDSSHKGPVMWKVFPCNDLIMTVPHQLWSHNRCVHRYVNDIHWCHKYE